MPDPPVPDFIASQDKNSTGNAGLKKSETVTSRKRVFRYKLQKASPKLNAIYPSSSITVLN